MGKCLSRPPPPTTADIMARFDRIHQTLNEAHQKLNNAQKYIVEANRILPNAHEYFSLQSIEKQLIEIERLVEKL